MSFISNATASDQEKRTICDHILGVENLAKNLQATDSNGGKTHILNRVIFDLALTHNEKARLYVFLALFGPGVLVSDLKNFFDDVITYKLEKYYPEDFFEKLFLTTLASLSLESKMLLLKWLFSNSDPLKKKCIKRLISQISKQSETVKKEIAQAYRDSVSNARKDFLLNNINADIVYHVQMDLFMGVSPDDIAHNLANEFYNESDVVPSTLADMPEVLKRPLISKLLLIRWPQHDVDSKIQALIVLGADFNSIVHSMQYVIDSPKEEMWVADRDQILDFLKLMDRDWQQLSFRSSAEHLLAWKTLFSNEHFPASYFLRCYPNLSPSIQSALFAKSNTVFYNKLKKQFYSDITYLSLNQDEKTAFLRMCKEQNLLSRVANERDVNEILIAGVRNHAFTPDAVLKQIGQSKLKEEVRKFCLEKMDKISPNSNPKVVCPEHRPKPTPSALVKSDLSSRWSHTQKPYSPRGYGTHDQPDLTQRLVNVLTKDHKNGYKLFP